MEVSADFKAGYVRALADVFEVLLESMDDEPKDMLLKELNLKKYE